MQRDLTIAATAVKDINTLLKQVSSPVLIRSVIGRPSLPSLPSFPSSPYPLLFFFLFFFFFGGLAICGNFVFLLD